MTTKLAGRALIVCACVVIAGCDSDMSPSRIDLAGEWTGSWQFVTGGVTVTDTVTASLSQNGTNVTGTWTAGGGTTGEVSFTAAESISGTLTLTQTTMTGQPCSATTTLSGSASSTALDFAAATPAPNGICQWAASNQFSFRR